MSQPPSEQPPHEPVPGNPYAQPGGYGEPGQIPPGGYGQPAPGQPGGYGQPGAAQPGGYGQPLGGTGYPPQPPYPGGYGSPIPSSYDQTPPTAPPTPPGSGGQGPFRRKRVVIVAAVVAGLLAVGGGVYLATGDDGKPAKPAASASDAAAPSASPSVDLGDGTGSGNGGASGGDGFNDGIKPGEARVWVRENETQLTSAGGVQFGPWRLGDIVARAMYKEVTGHAVADGALKWSVALETPVCGAGHTPTAHGKLVVATLENNTKRAHCKYLQQIDLATGKVGWKVEVPQESEFDTTNEFRLAITGDTVAVGHSAYASGFSAVDGKKTFGTWKTDGCSPYTIGGGTRLIGVDLCPSAAGTTKSQQLIEELDPATGKSKWNYKYPAGWNVGRVYSTDPLIVAARNGDTKAWNITSFAPDGKVRWQVEPKFQVTGACDGFGDGSGNLHACTFAANDAATLYLGTAGSGGAVLGEPETNEVVAIDLGTGKEKWRTKDSRGRAMRPVAVEGGKAVVYVHPGKDPNDSAAVATIAATGGAPQVLLQTPAAAAATERAFFLTPRMAWSDGRFFLLNGHVQSPTAQRKDRTLLSFGK
ncbi:PQQ-binding-like beta-propeller repeat protein [Streptomyces noboritoensis]|uniref:PQQ-binding-like beta-propeller repeat protein n=1 Tax=Streptomyces noboritoensis TaxID=67337 RepID=A0ABV6TEP9_9ACTN